MTSMDDLDRLCEEAFGPAAAGPSRSGGAGEDLDDLEEAAFDAGRSNAQVKPDPWAARFRRIGFDEATAGRAARSVAQGETFEEALLGEAAFANVTINWDAARAIAEQAAAEGPSSGRRVREVQESGLPSFSEMLDQLVEVIIERLGLDRPLAEAHARRVVQECRRNSEGDVGAIARLRNQLADYQTLPRLRVSGQ